jgi:hypothetical protein
MREQAMKMKTKGSILVAGLCVVIVAGTGGAETTSTGTVAAADTSARKPDVLSIFTNGIGAGAHAVYVTPKFDAVMQPNGHVFVYPKDKGVRIGKPLTMGHHLHYRGTLGKMPRPIVSFKNDKGPLMNPATLELSGKLEDDVDYSLTFDFDKAGVSLRGYVKDPAGLTTPTVLRLAIWMPAFTNFAPEVLQADREAKLKGLSVVIQSGPKKYVYPYAKGAVFAAPAERCWIEGPVYGARKLAFEVKAPKAAPMHPSIYENTAPCSGYTIYMLKQAMDSRKPLERLVLTIQ